MSTKIVIFMEKLGNYQDISIKKKCLDGAFCKYHKSLDHRNFQSVNGYSTKGDHYNWKIFTSFLKGDYS